MNLDEKVAKNVSKQTGMHVEVVRSIMSSFFSKLNDKFTSSEQLYEEWYKQDFRDNETVGKDSDNVMVYAMYNILFMEELESKTTCAEVEKMKTIGYRAEWAKKERRDLLFIEELQNLTDSADALKIFDNEPAGKTKEAALCRYNQLFIEECAKIMAVGQAAKKYYDALLNTEAFEYIRKIYNKLAAQEILKIDSVPKAISYNVIRGTLAHEMKQSFKKKLQHIERLKEDPDSIADIVGAYYYQSEIENIALKIAST